MGGEGSSNDHDGGVYGRGRGPNEKPAGLERCFVSPENKALECKFCRTGHIDAEIYGVFKIGVCKGCRYKNVELITKTACQKEFLLRDDELAAFPCLSRPNPHKGTWNGMCLYMRQDIERFAVKKFGSLGEIERTKRERADALMERKKRRLKARVKSLRRKTLLKRSDSPRHVHRFEATEEGKSACECGLVIEEEEI